MTSSLVGSEMCIRDRPQARSLRCNLVECATVHVAPLAGDGRGCRAAVSYTHLTLPTICSV
eukprot:10476722-Prorocentrum_lima.AAC.1